MIKIRRMAVQCLAIVLAGILLCLPVMEGGKVRAESVSKPASEPATESSAEPAPAGQTAVTPDGNSSSPETAMGYETYVEKHGVLKATAAKSITLQKEETGIDQAGNVSFPAKIETAGYYNLDFEYQFLQKGNKTDKISILVDGKIPYKELGSLPLKRLWVNSTEIKADDQGNDISPDQIELLQWQKFILHDKEGLLTDPMTLYMEPGEHILTFAFESSLVKIRLVGMTAYQPLVSYEQYLKKYEKTARCESGKITIEGESAQYKSEVYLLPQNDVTSPLTTPYNAAKIKLNTFGGANWKLANEKVSWTIGNVPQDGLYRIAIRFRQNIYEGISVHRRLYVNGEVPFEEANTLSFQYSDGWQSKEIGGYYIYLRAGKNDISLECSLGSSSEILEELKQTVLLLNSCYRRIIMVTGSVPDNNRDYSLEKQIPDLLEHLQQAYDSLLRVSKMVQDSDSKNNTLVSKINSVARQIRIMIDKPRDIAKSDRLDAFKSNISLTGTWLAMFREQPLEIDSISFLGEKDALPRADDTLKEEILHRFKRFIASFVEDYSSLGSTAGKTTIKVWLQSGRDQAGILKQMITSSFTPVYDIGVNLELVTGSIIEATLAGKGPDVALSRADTDPVNFAMRDALADLSKMKDFSSLQDRFSDGIFTPFYYQDGVYALPEALGFSMMFYRKDILEELKTEVPRTWDDMIKRVYPVLSRNNMEIGIGAMGQIAQMNSSNIFTNLLYQMGGKIYKEDLQTTALDSSESYAAFTKAVELYRDYLFPREYDAMSRFRTGEMPILIAPYTMYNVFAITIPELDGLWEMVPIPGTMQKDGKISIAQAATVSASVIFKKAKSKEACWEFLKWWTSSKVQTDYGMKVEAILGPAGRYNTANLEAMSQLPWDESQLTAMNQQLGECVFVEQLPGSYFTSRAINSAFMTSVLNGKNPTEQLLYWSEQINAELARKRIEFTGKTSGK